MTLKNSPFDFDGIVLLWILITATLVFVLVILLTRLFGLRSFARLSTFDFVFTLAKGALIAATALSAAVGFVEGTLGLIVIYSFEWLTATLRMRYDWFNKLVSNQPVLLMYRGRYLEENIQASRISHDDINFALRQKDVRHMQEVYAIVAEPTGQISILTGDPATAEKLLEGVIKHKKR